MARTTARVYTQRYNARTAGGSIHAHIVTSIVECECGCVQEELFPAALAVADDIRCSPEDLAAGRVGRARLGYRSVGADGTYATQLPRQGDGRFGNRVR